MPVEIRELVIKAVAESGREESTPPSQDDVQQNQQQSEVVEACVKEVLRILKRTQER